MKRPADPQSQASAQEGTDDNLAAALCSLQYICKPLATASCVSLIVCAANHQQLCKCAISRRLIAVGDDHSVIAYAVRFSQSRSA